MHSFSYMACSQGRRVQSQGVSTWQSEKVHLDHLPRCQEPWLNSISEVQNALHWGNEVTLWCVRKLLVQNPGISRCERGGFMTEYSPAAWSQYAYQARRSSLQKYATSFLMVTLTLSWFFCEKPTFPSHAHTHTWDHATCVTSCAGKLRCRMRYATEYVSPVDGRKRYYVIMSRTRLQYI